MIRKFRKNEHQSREFRGRRFCSEIPSFNTHDSGAFLGFRNAPPKLDKVSVVKQRSNGVKIWFTL